jgi:hypothetical protein
MAGPFYLSRNPHDFCRDTVFAEYAPAKETKQAKVRARRSSKRFLAQEDPITRLVEVHEVLLGQGALPRQDALEKALAELKSAGRVGDGEEQAVREAIDLAFRMGKSQLRFDTPKRGYVRSILNDPWWYHAEDWDAVVTNSLRKVGASRRLSSKADLIKHAATWARQAQDLEFSRLHPNTRLWQSLDKAIDRLVKSRRISVKGGTYAVSR